MNKTAIRNFAVWARNKLIADVSYRAGLMGVTAEGIADVLPQSTDNMQFFDIGMAQPYSISGEEIKQRKGLVDVINKKATDSDYKTAYNSVIEEVAYTWFNRMIAIRFMEVNDYLPSHVRVLSSESGKLEPDIVTTPFDAELFFAPGEQEQILQLKNDNKLDEVFRLLFIKECNSLYPLLPRLFENLSDYTELLLNVSFIDQDGVVYHLIHDIAEDDFNIEKGGQVEIIGWLYQYYNTEPKKEAFAKEGKITKEEIPAVTQLFTPDWIVRYMVENSLGRLWLEGHNNDSLKHQWKYYIDEVEQKTEVEAELAEIRINYEKLNPEDIKLIDPCMGSGHVLVYAFDVFMQIYDAAGWTQRDAARSILENNIYGLDIDDRAGQMAYFAVMMKARQYNRRILESNCDCNVVAIQESNSLEKAYLRRLGEYENIGLTLVNTFLDAKEYGSILDVSLNSEEILLLENKLNEIDQMADFGNLFDQYESTVLVNELTTLIKQAKIMINRYDAVITNPPYMGNMPTKMSLYVQEKYTRYKYDAYAVFIKKCLELKNECGFTALVTGDSWLTLSSFESMRSELLDQVSLVTLIGLGSDAFEAGFGTTAFVFAPSINRRGCYINVEDVKDKEEFYRECNKIKSFIHDNSTFKKLPGKAFLYSATDNELELFSLPYIENVLTPKAGIVAGNNDLYLRLWQEITWGKLKTDYAVGDTINDNWIPLHKGGGYRKYYGIHEYVIRLKKMLDDKTKNKSIRTGDVDYYFREGITWSTLSNKLGIRKSPPGFVYNTKGSMCFTNSEDKLDYFVGFYNSVVAARLMKILAPNLDFNSGTVVKVPYLDSTDERIGEIVQKNIEISKIDWDSFETSWDFKKNPLI